MLYMFIVACSTLTHQCDIRNPYKTTDPVKCEAELKEMVTTLEEQLKDQKAIVVFGSCTTIKNVGNPT